MGEFLALSGVVHAKPENVEDALRAFASSRGGSLVRRQGKWDEDGILVVKGSPSGTTVLYPGNFSDWEKASGFISEFLKVPVFSLHIHDGDLWMFTLYSEGRPVTQFNPIPAYWDDQMSKAEIDSWKGSSEVIRGHLPHVRREEVENYLVSWDLDDRSNAKAYPDDRFAVGDCWQMCDFMRRLGLEYPIDEFGKARGETFEFSVK